VIDGALGKEWCGVQIIEQSSAQIFDDWNLLGSELAKFYVCAQVAKLSQAICYSDQLRRYFSAVSEILVEQILQFFRR
jgi:hypothetical protein